MGNFLVNADAGCAWKAIAELWLRPRALLFDKLTTNRIKFSRRHRGLKSGAHGRQGIGNDPAPISLSLINSSSFEIVILSFRYRSGGLMTKFVFYRQ